jgi:O-antigen/teichoic acid export membrane protein
VPSATDFLRGLVSGLHPRKDSFSGEVLQSFLTNVGLTGLTVLSGIMLARLLGPEGRGQLAAIQALPLVVAGIGQLGLNQAAIFFGGRDRERVGRYAISAASLILLAGVPIVLGSAALAAWVLSEHTPGVVLASQIFMTLLFVNAIDGIAITTARALHRIPLWNALRVCPSGLWILLVGGFFAFGVADPERIALTYLVLYFFMALLLVFAVRRFLRGHWRPAVSLWPSMLKYGLPVAAGVAPRLLNQRLDQLVVAAMLPARDLGLYAVAVAWTGLGQLPALTITAVAFSKIAGMPDLPTKLRFIRKAVWITIAAAVAASAVLAVATPFVVPWVFGRDFAEAAPLAWVMLVAVVIRSGTWMIQTGMEGIGRPTVGMYSQWAGLALLVPTASALMPRFGALGAAWALVVAGLVSAVTAALLAHTAVRRMRESG